MHQILSGQRLGHWYARAGSSKRHWERLSSPDDITTFDGNLFTTFQNGLGPQGQASTDGNRGSTIVEFTQGGQMLISASAPGTTGAAAPNPAYPAVYSVSLDPYNQVAYVHALFYDEAGATATNGPDAGKTVKLGLTDPDSNEDVPWSAPRFAGDFMLTSQGDQEQIYVHDAGTWYQHLSVLRLSQSVDDTAWATSWHGTFFAVSTGTDAVETVSGTFWPGTAFVAVTPCDANGSPATCPGPGYPANYLGQLNMYTGQITAVSLRGPSLEPQGMIFIPS